MLRVRFVLVLFLAMTAIPLRAQAIVRGTVVPDDDKRFDPICAVGWHGTESYFGTGTLIAPNKVLTAKHVAIHLLDNGQAGGVAFRRKPAGSVGTLVPGGSSSLHTVAVDQIIHYGNGDMSILVLHENVAHITPMAFDTQSLGIEYGQTLYFAGWGLETETYGQMGGPRRLKYGTALRGHLAGPDSSNGFRLAPEPPDGCSTCGDTYNLWDSGGPFMRMSASTGDLTVIGTLTGGSGGYFSTACLPQLSPARSPDVAFLQALGAPVNPPAPALAYTTGRPLHFNNEAYIHARARVPVNTPGTPFDQASESGNGLIIDHPVSTSTNFSFSEAATAGVALQLASVAAGGCTGGSIESVVQSSTDIISGGGSDGIGLEYIMAIYHSGEIANCDPALRAQVSYTNIDATIGDSSVIANFTVPFTWNHAALNADLAFKLAGTADLRFSFELLIDYDGNGTNDEIWYPVVQQSGDENGDWDGYCAMPVLESGGLYTLQMRVSKSTTLSSMSFFSPGCSASDSFSLVQRQSVSISISPIFRE